jgi:hypothetical protein
MILSTRGNTVTQPQLTEIPITESLIYGFDHSLALVRIQSFSCLVEIWSHGIKSLEFHSVGIPLLRI